MIRLKVESLVILVGALDHLAENHEFFFAILPQRLHLFLPILLSLLDFYFVLVQLADFRIMLLSVSFVY